MINALIQSEKKYTIQILNRRNMQIIKLKYGISVFNKVYMNGGKSNRKKSQITSEHIAIFRGANF